MSTSKVSSKESKKKGKRGSGLKGAQGRRFTAAEKQHALTLIVSGMARGDVAKAVGTTVESVRRWVRVAEAAGTMPAAPVSQSVSPKAEPVRVEAASEAEGVRSVVPVTSESHGRARSIYAPKDPGQGLSTTEQAAILELKRKHPSYGPAQIRTQLKRFKGWRVSIKAIARWLKQNGYELVHRESRSKRYSASVPAHPSRCSGSSSRTAGWNCASAAPG